MSNFNESKATLTLAKSRLDSVIELSRKHRLTTCRLDVVIGGEHICDFEAPVGVVHELVSVGLKAADVADRLVTALGLDKEYGTA